MVPVGVPNVSRHTLIRADRSELRETLRFLLLYARKRKVRKSRCAVRSVLGACGAHEAVGGVRRWRRSWVKMHPLPVAIQVLGRRKHRSAAPAGPSVARLLFYGYRDARFRTASHAEVQTFMR